MKDVIETYENYREEDRLTTNNARRIEFLTTVRAFRELLPDSGSVLDCAAGTGIYAFYLADRGYEVIASDITPRHVDIMRRLAEDKPYTLPTLCLDARDLGVFQDESFDIVLNMGPFYHLLTAEDRERNLSECIRVCKMGGLVITSYISRLMLFPYLAMRYEAKDLELIRRILKTGELSHEDEKCFWTDSYFASVEEMEACYSAAGLKIVDHFAQDGLAPMMAARVDAMSEEEFGVWCDYHYLTCRERSTIGTSNHIIIAGRKEI